MFRILQLTRKFPFPPKDGESLNLSSFNAILSKKGFQIDLLSFNTSKHYFDPEQIPSSDNPYRNIYSISLDNKVKLLPAILNLFSNLPFHIDRFINKEFKNKIFEICKNNEYDFIFFESLYLAYYFDLIKLNSKAKLIYRAHNVEFEIWERITANTSNIIKKVYLSYLTRKLKRFEIKQLNDYDLFVALTRRDLEIFKNLGLKRKNYILPAGIRNDMYISKDLNLDGRLRISFLGSLDWIPNIEGIKWFLQNCWNEIKNINPEIELHIAGRNTPAWLYSYADDRTFIHGEVQSSIDFLNSCQLTIVPLFAGSGIRLKILEGLALGRIIITTSLGLEGIDAKDEVLIAETKDDFIEKINYCFENKENLKVISLKAQQLFSSKYNLNNIIDEFVKEISVL